MKEDAGHPHALHSGFLVKLFGGTAMAALLLTSLLSQESTLQIGYGRIEPEAGSHVAGVALYSSSNADGVLLWEAAVGAVEPMERGRVYVEQTERTRTAIALANTEDQELSLTAVLRDLQGAEVDQESVTLASGTQTATFIRDWFREVLTNRTDFLGTLTLESGDPEARFAAVTLRENLNHRGEAIYATLPVADLDAVEMSPSSQDVLAFPQVGGGGGLTTQLVFINPTETVIQGRVDLMQADGTPLLLSLDGVETSEVPFSLEANGVFRAELTSADEVRSGYAVLHVDSGSRLPSGTAIFQLKSGDHVITEAGVPATVPTQHVRMLVDNLGTRTGVAVAPLGNAETPVRFDLKEIDGTAISSVEEAIGEVGHARYADEIFPDMRPGFLGILEVSCDDPFAAVTLKLTTNSRGEPVLTTLPVADLSNPPDSSLQVIPQIGLGAGLETRLIVLGAEASNGARGRIDFVSFDSTVMEIPVFGTPQSSVAFEIGPGGGWRFDPTTPLAVSDILLDSEINLAKGQSLELSPTVVDDQGVHHTSVHLSFQSTRPDVVSVSTSGTLVGKKAGFATLVVSAGDVVRSTAVTVVEATSGLTGYTINHVDADTSGKLYLASTPNQVILEAQSFQATPETYAGISQRAGYHDDVRLSALFDAPSFLALDRNTNALYVSDGGNQRIRQVTPGNGGVVGTLDLSGPGLEAPQGLALDDEGYLWVADSARHTIGRIDLETNDYETIAGQSGAAGDVDGTAAQARFHSPHGLAVERESTLRKLEREARGEPPPPTRILVADTGNGAIRRITRTSSEPDADWKVETVAINTPNVATRIGRYRLQQTGSPFTSPTGISVDAAGNIYVSDSATGEVSLILPTGAVVQALPAGASTEGVTVTTNGQLLVADGEQGAREITYAPPEIENILRTPIGNNQERITIVGRNFAPESEVLLKNELIADALIVDSERITFTASTFDINGAVIRVENRGGVAQLTVAFPECKGTVVFEDHNLEAAVRGTLGLEEDEPITCGMAVSLDSLYAVDRGIESLAGLEFFTGLTSLKLYQNQISDLTPLAHLTQLQDLELGIHLYPIPFLVGNNVSNIEPLAGLTQLTTLGLANNQIKDLQPLAGLTKLVTLELERNEVNDLLPLAGLTQLTTLELYDNTITDISPLEGLTQLTYLDLSGVDGNSIHEIGALSSLTALTDLRLRSNEINDVAPLIGLIQLQFLDLGDNQISDISSLSGLTHLHSLVLRENQIRDLTPLAGLNLLTVLDLDMNEIHDLSPLAGLTELRSLRVVLNQISDLEPLTHSDKLSYLLLYGNQITDISALAGLSHLENLDLGDNMIGDLTPLGDLTLLVDLGLEDNAISNLAPLVGLSGLQYLYLDRNRISGLGPLSNLSQLYVLHLGMNEIEDLSPLSSLTRLGTLLLDGNAISDIKPLVANDGLGMGDALNLRQNLLGPDDCSDLQDLISRGVEVYHDVECP